MSTFALSLSTSTRSRLTATGPPAHRRIWDTSTGQCLRTLVHEDNPPVTSVCFAPNGRYVLASSSDSCLRLWDYVSGTVKKTYQGHENGKFSIGGCFGVLRDENENEDQDQDEYQGEEEDDRALTTNGARRRGGRARTQAFIAAPSEDGDIVLWDVRTKEVVQRIRGAHDGVCFWVDVHGDTLVSAGQDGRIKVFRQQQRRQRQQRRRGRGRDAESGAREVTKTSASPVDDGAAAREPADMMSLDGDADAENGVPGADGAARDETTPLKDEDVKKEE